MQLRFSRMTLVSMGVASACLLAAGLANGQAPPRTAPAAGGARPLLAEQAFKNIQLLRGIPVDEFMDTMGFFAASTGLNCTDCHTEESGGNWAKYADDTPLKQTARRMILMVRTINQSQFAGKRNVTCYTCHRGSKAPEVIPSLAVQYATPILEEPYEVVPLDSASTVAEQTLDKYLQALGGAQRLAAVNSFVGKGTYDGYDTEFTKYPVEVLAKAPNQRSTVVHILDGDATTTYDGRIGWIAGPETLKPLPVMPLTGGDLDGARLDAELSFPSRIKQVLTDWKAGTPTTIEDHDVLVVQGRLMPGALPVKLYFDKQSGLLVRQVRYTNSPVGINPTQVDYSDYRDVSGVKMPFHWVVTWTDGRSTVELTELKANVPVAAATFGKPAPPAPQKPAGR